MIDTPIPVIDEDEYIEEIDERDTPLPEDFFVSDFVPTPEQELRYNMKLAFLAKVNVEMQAKYANHPFFYKL